MVKAFSSKRNMLKSFQNILNEILQVYLLLLLSSKETEIIQARSRVPILFVAIDYQLQLFILQGPYHHHHVYMYYFSYISPPYTVHVWNRHWTVDHKFRGWSPAAALMSFSKTLIYICHPPPRCLMGTR